MDVHAHGGRRIEKIERRITRLSRRAEKLFARQLRAEQRVADALRPASERRAQRRLERLRARREQLVQSEIRSIMLALKDESHRTRERLDRELQRMAPLELEWERLRSMFDTLEATLCKPALDQLTVQWRGGLAIPDFPVTEQTGYIKPFPPKAILF